MQHSQKDIHIAVEMREREQLANRMAFQRQEERKIPVVNPGRDAATTQRTDAVYRIIAAPTAQQTLLGQVLYMAALRQLNEQDDVVVRGVEPDNATAEAREAWDAAFKKGGTKYAEFLALRQHLPDPFSAIHVRRQAADSMWRHGLDLKGRRMEAWYRAGGICEAALLV